MKTLNNAVSPFIILLAPALLIILILFLNPASEQEEEKLEAATCFKVPTLIGVTQSLFIK